MSTSLLYHAFGIPAGYKHISTHYVGGAIHFEIEENHFSRRCSCCNKKNLTLKGFVRRQFRALPIGAKEVFITLNIARVKCLDCQVIRQVKVRFSEGSKRYTRRFKKLVLELSQHMSVQAVSSFLKVGWDLVKEIQKNHLLRRYGNPNIRKLKRIAIDEIYMGKKSGYLTVVLDLQRSVVVFVGKGKSGESLIPFWKKLKRANIELEVVATDMGAAFIKSARDYQSQAVNVVDHFHVIKLFNEKLTKLRRDLQRDCENVEDKAVFKGIRWLLLMRSDKLEKKDEKVQDRLKQALELNEPLAKAYYLKELLREIWNQVDKASASKLMTEWIKMADSSGVNLLKSFAKTIGRLRAAILAYYDFDGLSSGPIEGINNKIKTIHKVAYGYRDHEFFKLKILSMHESRKIAFTG
jgi:transposase